MFGLIRHTSSPIYTPGARGISGKLLALAECADLSEGTRSKVRDFYLKATIETQAEPKHFLLKDPALKTMKKGLEREKAESLMLLAAASRGLIGHAVNPLLKHITQEDVKLKNELAALIPFAELDEVLKDKLHFFILNMTREELKSFTSAEGIEKSFMEYLEDRETAPQRIREEKQKKLEEEALAINLTPFITPLKDMEEEEAQKFIAFIEKRLSRLISAGLQEIQINNAADYIEQVKKQYKHTFPQDSESIKVRRQNKLIKRREAAKERARQEVVERFSQGDGIETLPRSEIVDRLIGGAQFLYEKAAHTAKHYSIEKAVEKKDVKAIRFFLKNRVNPNVTDGKAWTLFMQAVSTEDINVVRAFLYSFLDDDTLDEVDVNQVNNYGWTPLMAAASQGCDDIVDLLLENGADAAIRNQGGKAAYNMVLEQVEHYLKQENFEVVEKYFRTAIRLAPNTQEARKDLNVFYEQLANEKHIDLLELVAAENHADVLTRCVLGDYYAERGDYKRAWEYYRRATKMDPTLNPKHINTVLHALEELAEEEGVPLVHKSVVGNPENINAALSSAKFERPKSFMGQSPYEPVPSYMSQLTRMSKGVVTIHSGTFEKPKSFEGPPPAAAQQPPPPAPTAQEGPPTVSPPAKIADKPGEKTEEERALDSFNSTIKLLYNSGTGKGILIEAVKQYSRLVERFPNAPFSHRRMAIVLRELIKQKRLTLKEVGKIMVWVHRKCLELNENSFDALVGFGEVLELFGDQTKDPSKQVKFYSEAVKYYCKALEADDPKPTQDYQAVTSRLNALQKKIGEDVFGEPVSGHPPVEMAPPERPPFEASPDTIEALSSPLTDSILSFVDSDDPEGE